LRLLLSFTVLSSVRFFFITFPIPSIPGSFASTFVLQQFCYCLKYNTDNMENYELNFALKKTVYLLSVFPIKKIVG